MLVDDFDSRLMPALLEVYEAESPLLDLGAAAALQSIATLGAPQAWLTRTEPFVAGYGRLRVGVFNWTTDRDAFVRSLLGDPVPVTPRYARAGLAIAPELVGDLWAAQEDAGFQPGEASELFGMTQERAVESAKELIPILRRISGSEGGAAEILEAVLKVAPQAFANSPFGRSLLPLARGAPRWRTPAVAAEWAGAFDLGVVGCLGMALWAPGAYEMRKHRRSMAAHLRYLFDYHVSPWNLWAEEHRRREALAIYWRRLPRLLGQEVPTIRELALILRRKRPLLYEQEREPSTIRRLYRTSATLRRADGGLSRRRHAATL